MKYSEIIELYEYFQPIVDITEEKENYWKQFIPTKDFVKVLSDFLTSMTSIDANRKSIWLQGAYGTGKSHATTVIKHLLWDDQEKIEDFVENLDAPLRERLRNFRKNNKVFPVVIKGISGITDPKSFSLSLEKAVKDALKRENIEITTESEFEKYINHIKNAPHMNYETVIENNPELKVRVHNRDNLIAALERRDVEILKLLENVLEFNLPHKAIDDWLVEVSEELFSKGISAMAIYWDEFTSLLELSSVSPILSILQNIAEKTMNNNIYLFIVSHRHPQQANTQSMDYNKLKDRFITEEYSMEKVTTFHILSNAIRKKNQTEWENLRDSIFTGSQRLNNTIFAISKDDNNLRRDLRNLFPIHPYSAYIASSISNYVGSAERSIFSFLYDKDKGFQKFIEEFPKENGNSVEYFLTPDMLWDFFLNEFERRPNEKISTIIAKYRQNEDQLRNLEPAYLEVFKGVLLLNILYSLLSISNADFNLYSPSEENVVNLFSGTSLENAVPNILQYFDEKDIISKNPDNLFLVAYSALSEKEVNEEKERVRQEYSDVTKLLDTWVKSSLRYQLTSNTLRDTDIQIYPSSIEDFNLARRIKSDFKKPYCINVALFLAKNSSEISKIKYTIERVHMMQDLNAENVLFAVSDIPLSDENFEKFVDYLAKSRVAEQHEYGEDAENYKKYAEKIVNQWIDKVKNGQFETYFRGKEDNIVGRSFDSYLNTEISPKIFFSGLENLKNLTNRNVWTSKKSEKVAEIFACAQDRDDLEEKTKNAPYKDLRYILMDNDENYIVDKKLNILQTADTDHPTVKICRDVKDVIMKYEGKSFNLGDELLFLKEPPYGIYPNMVSFAVISFAMRQFIDKLYEQGSGRKIDKNLLKEKVINLFSYWEEDKNRDKLDLRLGTDEERKLTELLVELFNLKEGEDLNKARWGMREWIKNKGYPIWALKTRIKGNDKMSTAIDTLFYLNKSADSDIGEEDAKKFYEILSLTRNHISSILTESDLKEGFKRWAANKLGQDKITQEEFESLMAFLRENMQEEVGLWEEDKVELKLRDWILNMTKEEKKRDFIRIISKIFGLEHIENLENLKVEVRNKINALGFPLWTLKYVFNIEEIKKAIDDIENFVKLNIPLNSETINDLLNDIRLYENLIGFNLTPEMAKKGLSYWLKTKCSSSADLNSFIEYARNRIEKDPYLWEEDDLEDVLKEFNFSKTLGDIFGINTVLSLDNLRANIKNKISSLLYPFWMIELTDDGKSAFDSIKKFVLSIYPPPLNELEAILNDIDEKKTRELLSHEKLKTLCNEWLDNWIRENFKISVSIESKQLDRIMEETRRKMPSEEFHWNRDAFENQINKNEELRKTIFKNRQEEMKMKIATADNKNLKEILLSLIDEYPEICIKLEEYLK